MARGVVNIIKGISDVSIALYNEEELDIPDWLDKQDSLGNRTRNLGLY